MKILFDTVNEDFYCALINDKNQIIKSFFYKNHKEKVELITQIFNIILISYDINDIKEFYINIGPGSFTGSRISLVFCRTIAKIKNIKVFTINNFIWLAANLQKKEVSIYSGGNKFFIATVEKGKIISKIKIKDNILNSTKFNYKIFEKNISQILSLFIEEKDIDSIKPFYLKAPQIGKIEK